MGSQCCKPDDEAAEEEKRRTMKKKKELQEKRRRERRRRSAASRRIQAWWRGTLVRRTLLAAALHAWVIQLWWRGLRWRRGCALRQGLLHGYALEELAAVRLQSCFRRWRCHRGCCPMRGTICLSRDPESCSRVQIREGPRAPQARRLGAAKDLEFRVEILTV